MSTIRKLHPFFFQISLFRKNEAPSESVFTDLKEVLLWIEDFVAETGYVTGLPHMTIADLSMLPIYTTLRSGNFVSDKEYPGLEKWVQSCKGQLKNFEKMNSAGADLAGGAFKAKLQEITAAN